MYKDRCHKERRGTLSGVSLTCLIPSCEILSYAIMGKKPKHIKKTNPTIVSKIINRFSIGYTPSVKIE